MVIKHLGPFSNTQASAPHIDVEMGFKENADFFERFLEDWFVVVHVVQGLTWKDILDLNAGVAAGLLHMGSSVKWKNACRLWKAETSGTGCV